MELGRGARLTGLGHAMVYPPGTGQPFRIGADRFVRKGGTSERSPSFSVVEYTGAAGVPGPPPHVHRAFEEAWYILEGRVRFRAGRRSIEAIPGTYLLVPRGIPHAFEVAGSRPARWLGIFSPGKYVELIERLGDLVPRSGPPDGERIRALFRRYDTDLAELPPTTKPRKTPVS